MSRWIGAALIAAGYVILGGVIGGDYSSAERIVAAIGWAIFAFIAGVKVGKIDERFARDVDGDDEGAGA